MQENTIINQIVQHQKNALKGPWYCMEPNCFERAINSHILQKNRYLSLLANNKKKLYRFEVDLFSELIVFKERGTSQLLSFPGFCRKHDDLLFRKIEKKPINFFDRESIHLLCYRTQLDELRKKEIIIKQYEAISRDKRLWDKLDIVDKRRILDTIKGNRLGITDCKRTIQELDNDKITSQNSVFQHFTREIDILELFICGVFCLETTEEQDFHNKVLGKPYDYLSPIFIHLTPINSKKSMLVFSYETRNELRVKRYLNPIFNGTEREVAKQLSDLMFLQVENWVCTDNFYQKNIKPREEYISNLIISTRDVLNENASLSFNIFEI